MLVKATVSNSRLLKKYNRSPGWKEKFYYILPSPWFDGKEATKYDMNLNKQYFLQKLN